MSPAQIVLGVLLAAALAYTVYGYPHRYGALTGRSRLYRTVGLFLLSLLLMLVFMGQFIDFYAGIERKVGALRWVFYQSSCLLLGLMLPIIAFLDTLESVVAVRREKRDYLLNMWQEEQARLGMGSPVTTSVQTGVQKGTQINDRLKSPNSEQQPSEQQNKN